MSPRQVNERRVYLVNGRIIITVRPNVSPNDSFENSCTEGPEGTHADSSNQNLERLIERLKITGSDSGNHQGRRSTKGIEETLTEAVNHWPERSTEGIEETLTEAVNHCPERSTEGIEETLTEAVNHCPERSAEGIEETLIEAVNHCPERSTEGIEETLTEAVNHCPERSTEGMEETLTEAVNHCPERNEQRAEYLSWDDFFMASALLAAKRSKDPVTQVGACIVNEYNIIVGLGYNGLPQGCQDKKFPWGKSENPLLSKHSYVCHAEMNAVLNKNVVELRGCRMYVALFPCCECAKIIIQSGIKEVIYLSDKHRHKPSTQAAKIMFEAANVNFWQYVPKKEELAINFAV